MHACMVKRTRIYICIWYMHMIYSYTSCIYVCILMNNLYIPVHRDVAEALLDRGANPDFQDPDGSTPLYAAAFQVSSCLLSRVDTRRIHIAHAHAHAHAHACAFSRCCARSLSLSLHRYPSLCRFISFARSSRALARGVSLSLARSRSAPSLPCDLSRLLFRALYPPFIHSLFLALSLTWAQFLHPSISFSLNCSRCGGYD